MDVLPLLPHQRSVHGSDITLGINIVHKVRNSSQERRTTLRRVFLGCSHEPDCRVREEANEDSNPGLMRATRTSSPECGGRNQVNVQSARDSNLKLDARPEHHYSGSLGWGKYRTCMTAIPVGPAPSSSWSLLYLEGIEVATALNHCIQSHALPLGNP